MAPKNIHSIVGIVGISSTDVEVTNAKGSQLSSLNMHPHLLPFQEAREIAEKMLTTLTAAGEVRDVKIIDEQTIDKFYAWLFYYEVQQQTGHLDAQIGVASNGVILVSKHDGHVSTFARHLTLDEMIEEYEETHHIWKLRLPSDIHLDPKMRLHLKRFLGLNNIRFGRHKTFKKNPDNDWFEIEIIIYAKIIRCLWYSNRVNST